ncbi:MAG: hypothetical protein QOC54_1318, partial [Baekduia sp.]|nr:hypothetical protein [Baekduia sp.]
MSFLKNVLHDLVEKRLWPVAVALVVALIAVPIVLGGSSNAGSTGADVAALPTTNGLANHRDVARADVVSLEEQAAGSVQRAGTVRNPFVQHHQPKVVDQTVTNAVNTAKGIADALGAATSGGSGSGSGSGTATTPASTPPASKPAPAATPTSPTKTNSSAADTYRVKLKFGESGAEKT